MSFYVAGGTIVAGVGSAVIANKGNQKASKASAQGSQNAIDESRYEFNTIQRNGAPWRNIGVNALNDINTEFGYAPSNGFGQTTPADSGASIYASPGIKDDGYFNTGAGKVLNPWTVTSKLGGAGKILDPAGGLLGNLFGNKHGDEKRNLDAFLKDNQIYDMGNGTLAFADGRTFNQSQLKDFAGTYYGATYAPDGDQSGWQQKYQSLLGTLPAPTAGTGAGSPGSGASPASTGTGFTASPDYAFRRDEGTRGIERTAAARGGAFSGNALKALSEFNSNLASGEYSNWFNRRATLAGLGQTANSQENQAALYTGAQVGNALQNEGDARASGVVDRYSGYGNAINQVGQAAGYYFRNRPSNSSNDDPSGIGYFKPTARRV